MRKVIRAVSGSRGRGRSLGHGFGCVGFRHAATSAANIFLSLAAIISSVLLDGLGGACGVVSSKIFHLVGLGVDNLLRAGKIVVDELLVVFVEQRTEVDARDANEGETPQWNDLDEPV